MSRISTCFAVLLSASLHAAAQEPQATPNDSLRESIGKWIATMQEIQKSEDDWERDRRVLNDYRESLRSEIADLEEAISAARTRKQAADKESLENVEKKKAYAEAKTQLAEAVQALEKRALARARTFPQSLLNADNEPKMAQALAEIRKDAALTGDEADDGLPKRLNNILVMLAEAEKYQQTVHLEDELHQNPEGREFNMKMVYFGLGAAFGVNEGGDFAILGRPGEDGWVYQERNELAAEIQRLVQITTGDREAGFVPLPIEFR